MARIAIGALGWLAGSLATAWLATCAWNRLRTGVRHFDAALWLALWMFTVTLVVLCACATGCLDARLLAGCSVACLTWPVLHGRAEGSRLRNVARQTLGRLRGFARTYPVLTVLFLTLGLVLAARTWCHAWFLPPYVWDTLTYHLPRLPEWIQHHGVFVVPTPIDRLYWPANFELFQCWFVLFFHHDFLVELAGTVPYALAVLSVYSLSRSLGASTPWAGGGAALFSTTPTLVQSVVSCKNDIAIAGWFLFMAAAIAEMTRHHGPWRAHTRYVVILALAFGAALGTKPYIVFITPGLVMLYLLLFASRTRRAAGQPGRPLGVGLTGIGLAAAVGVGLFWYVRNAVIFHNPFHPSDFRLFGHLVSGTGSGPEYAHSEFQPADIVASLRLLCHKIFDPAGALNPELPNAAGWGWFAVSCGLPCAVVLLFRRHPARWVSVSFFISLCVLFGFVLVDLCNLRYAIWFPAIFSLAFVTLAPALRTRAIRDAFVALAVLAGAANVAGALNNGYLSPASWRAHAAVPVLERHAAQMTGVEFTHLLQTVPRGETIGYDMHPNGWLYPLYGADYAWKTKAFEVLATSDVPARMREMGLRYLFCPYQGKGVKERLKPYLVAGELKEAGWFLYVLPR